MGVLFLFLLLCSAAFVIRFLFALWFGEKPFEQMRRRPLFYTVWAIISLFFFYASFTSTWPPHWLELKQQRQKALERVQSAGGWDAVRKECITLAETNKEQGLQLFWPHAEQLPPALAVLKPQQIELNPVGNSAVPVVHIKIFGMHATGGHSTPYYGFDVLCEKEITPYQVPPAPYASGNSHFHYQKIAAWCLRGYKLKSFHVTRGFCPLAFVVKAV